METRYRIIPTRGVSVSDEIPVTQFAEEETLRTVHSNHHQLILIRLEDVVHGMKRYLAAQLSLGDPSLDEVNQECIRVNGKSFYFTESKTFIDEVTSPKARTTMIKLTVSLREILEA